MAVLDREEAMNPYHFLAGALCGATIAGCLGGVAYLHARDWHRLALAYAWIAYFGDEAARPRAVDLLYDELRDVEAALADEICRVEESILSQGTVLYAIGVDGDTGGRL